MLRELLTRAEHNKVPAAKLCVDNGSFISPTNAEIEAAIELITNRMSLKMDTKTLPTLIVSIILSVFIFLSERVITFYLEWNEEHTFLIALLCMMIGVQMLILFLFKARYKYSAFISLVLALSIFVLYKDWMGWMGLQVTGEQSIERFLVLTYLMFYAIMAVSRFNLKRKD
jgi:membrane-associated HD superfamily phosphohydrolase